MDGGKAHTDGVFARVRTRARSIAGPIMMHAEKWAACALHWARGSNKEPHQPDMTNTTTTTRTRARIDRAQRHDAHRRTRGGGTTRTDNDYLQITFQLGDTLVRDTGTPRKRSRRTLRGRATRRDEGAEDSDNDEDNDGADKDNRAPTQPWYLVVLLSALNALLLWSEVLHVKDPGVPDQYIGKDS